MTCTIRELHTYTVSEHTARLYCYLAKNTNIRRYYTCIITYLVMYVIDRSSIIIHVSHPYLDQVSTDCPESSNDFNEVVVTTRVKLVLQPLVQVGRERLLVLVR